MLDKVSTCPAFKWLLDIVWMDFNISLPGWMCPFSMKSLQMWSHKFFFEVLLIGLWSVGFIYSVLIKLSEALEWLDWHLGFRLPNWQDNPSFPPRQSQRNLLPLFFSFPFRQLQQQQAELEVHQRDGLSSYDLTQVRGPCWTDLGFFKIIYSQTKQFATRRFVNSFKRGAD